MTTSPKAVAPGKLKKCSATILLVEDNDKLRALLGDVLRAQGYLVLEAANGREALRLCEQGKAPIQILLTDMAMPHINGQKLVEHLRSRNMGMQVIFMSGYAASAPLTQTTDKLNITFIQKPFKPTDLLEKVRQVIESL